VKGVIMDKNKSAHEAVWILLFEDIINTDLANKLHAKIDKKIKKKIEVRNKESNTYGT
jgi:hypothetical protein